MTVPSSLAAGSDSRPPDFVDALLDSLHLGRFVDQGLPVPVGRNQNHRGTTESGQDVFVKVLVGEPRELAGRLRRALDFQRIADGVAVPGLRAPRCLGHDPARGVLVFELLRDARSGRELLADQEFDADLAARSGSAIGSLHAMVADPAIDTSTPHLPPVEWLRALPQHVFDNSSGAALRAWRLMQRDRALVDALVALRAGDERTAFVPAHCDLRLDQLLRCDGELYVIDWEEFRLADPARDVGAFVGEWLHHAVFSIRLAGDEDAPEVRLSGDDIRAAIATAIDGFRPTVASFYAAYRARRPVGDGFAARCCAYAGWHLLDRMLAATERQATLGAVERAGAGIGRTLVCAPDRFVDTVGLG
ncbi:class V lanthionine synthetase subunit LxmK [Actinophytocola sp.]|uniref:class V lanthionine synthetase subunit LxmK n=1 Tax=Actinophytocola sp. TaxID=1872138 RepID=UPI00389A13D1